MDETKPGPDEVRMRGILRRHGVGYDAELPAVPPGLPEGFEAAPDPDAWWDELYPDEQRPPPKPVPAPRPLAPEPAAESASAAEPEPEPDEQGPGVWSRTWDAFTDRVSPWKAVLALAVAVVPIPWTGYSAAVTWAYTVSEARGFHLGFGYGLGFGAFVLAVRRLTRTRSVLALWCTAVTFIGLFGAMSWYDPILWLTGVHK